MPTIKQVGDLCPDCGTPMIAGRKGAYCKPCYINWAESQKPVKQLAQEAKQEKRETQPDWDKISEGKVRHGLVVALIQRGEDYPEIAKIADQFLPYIMTGEDKPF